MKKGFIKKMISNQYTIIDLESYQELNAQARGLLRHVKVDSESSFNKQLTKKTKIEQKIMTISPKVGDYVDYEDHEGQIIIKKIHPRKNDLTRPDVCNIDQAILVFSSISPDFSFRLLDRFLIILSQENLIPIIVISKIDLISEDRLLELKKDLSYYEKIGYQVYYVNSKQRIGIDVLEHVFEHKLSVLAGQTGVGKSTLLNALMPELKLKTQEISKALGRGKHTTRHTELYPFNKGYIVDTPGFSKIEFKIFHKEDLKNHYPDFEALSDLCKFRSKCMHHREPDCEVKRQVEAKSILQSRYDNYIAFIEEITSQKEMY